MDEFTDEELLILYKRGRREAFERLYERHRQGLFLFLLRMCGDRPLAEELLQDVLLKVSRAAATYEPRGRFRPWLYRIATNHCLNALAGPGRSSRGRVIYLSALSPDGSFGRAAASSEPQERAQAKELRESVLEAIAELEPRYRAALLLREVLELKLEEIAQTLDLPSGTVKTLLHRGRRQLREKLAWLVTDSGSGSAREA